MPFSHVTTVEVDTHTAGVYETVSDTYWFTKSVYGQHMELLHVSLGKHHSLPHTPKSVSQL